MEAELFQFFKVVFVLIAVVAISGLFQARQWIVASALSVALVVSTLTVGIITTL